ncbi:hypothetical protein LCGC14_0579090 [marine sediment metagenome]|uniref:Uncharacterized protein n=1 Tax=marine sediment metagenome TaxID=412755 RepID=A0A0F9RH18_9ZZZZ
MNPIILFFSIFTGLLILFVVVLLMVILLSVTRITETNKQLMILVAGEKSAKPELLRALVASQKPPQKNLKGIASGKKKDKKPANSNYTLEVGGN